MKVISVGAEAKIIYDNKRDVIIKRRVEKEYRLKELDAYLRKFRTKREYKVIKKAYDNDLSVPEPLGCNLENYEIIMRFIEGKPLKDILESDNFEGINDDVKEGVLLDFFNEVMKLHSLDIVHGDLTTLNAIVDKRFKVYLIDFGLSEFNAKIEEKAEDLYLFFKNIKNEHYSFFGIIEVMKKEYKERFGEKVLLRLEEVERRGRNKSKEKKEKVVL